MCDTMTWVACGHYSYSFIPNFLKLCRSEEVQRCFWGYPPIQKGPGVRDINGKSLEMLRQQQQQQTEIIK